MGNGTEINFLPDVKMVDVVMEIAYYKSPIGFLEIKHSGVGISAINFLDELPSSTPDSGTNILVKDCIMQLDEYFNSKRKQFDLKFDLSGTDFQRKVWNELLKIPYGCTCTYLDIAKKLGNIMALRAVGNANGRNPVPVVIPCHRVIGSTGKLVGFGGGLWRKKWLLEFENSMFQKELF